MLPHTHKCTIIIYCLADTSFETVYTPATTPGDSPYGSYVATPVATNVVAIPDNEYQMKTPEPKHSHNQSHENVTASAAPTQTSEKRKKEANEASSPAGVDPNKHLSFAVEPANQENESEASPVQPEPKQNEKQEVSDSEEHQEASFQEPGNESFGQPSPSPIISSTPNATPNKAVTQTPLSTPTSAVTQAMQTPTVEPMQTPETTLAVTPQMQTPTPALAVTPQMQTPTPATPSPKPTRPGRKKQESWKKKKQNAAQKAKQQKKKRPKRASPKPSPAPIRPPGRVCSGGIVMHVFVSLFGTRHCCFGEWFARFRKYLRKSLPMLSMQVRRSTRTRMKPLQYWKNERIVSQRFQENGKIKETFTRVCLCVYYEKISRRRGH